jgi:hypothetical protein
MRNVGPEELFGSQRPIDLSPIVAFIRLQYLAVEGGLSLLHFHAVQLGSPLEPIPAAPIVLNRFIDEG